MPPDMNRNMEPVGPMGSLITCATDVVKWLRLHLNGGATDEGTQIVPSELLSATRTPESSLRSNPFRLLEPGGGWPEAQAAWAYGLGWTTGSYRGYRRDNHVRARATRSWGSRYRARDTRSCPGHAYRPGHAFIVHDSNTETILSATELDLHPPISLSVLPSAVLT
jgi:CubicO group peptidase (beta-lactamase class C family)